jgi:hypothetical protein
MRLGKLLAHNVLRGVSAPLPNAYVAFFSYGVPLAMFTWATGIGFDAKCL